MAIFKKYRMDKTAFSVRTFEEADNAMRDYSNHTFRERLHIYWYLTSIVYKFDLNNPPKMDKTVFSMRKHES